MVRITNSTAAFFQRSLGQIGGLRGTAESLQQQIATGQRLERSSDDPVASARLRTLSRQDRLSEQQDKLRETMTKQFIAADRNVSASQSTLSFIQSQIEIWNNSDR